MPEYPLVTIVTPTLNQAAYIRETIDSVAAQDYPNVEHIIADGGSTDGTLDILRSYGNKIIWWSEKDAGQAAAINTAIRRSAGLIISWLNSDDTLLPSAASWAVDAFRRNPDAGVVFGNTLFTGPSGVPLFASTSIPFQYEDFITKCRNPIPQPSSFFRREAFKQAGGLDPNLHYFFDWDLWLRIGLNWPIVYDPVLLSTYRLHSASKTEGSKCYAHELEQVYRKFFGGSLPPKIRLQESEAFRNMYGRSAEYYAHGGLRWKALQCKFWRMM